MKMHKGMTLAEMAREIHENAKSHGWWDEQRDEAEVYALIHSEWSEALEEYRDGMPDRWYVCLENEEAICGGKGCGCQDYQANNAAYCPERGSKPEGICVELIDSVIRILDYIAHCGDADKYNEGTADWCLEMCGEEGEEWTNEVQGMSLPALVNRLHNEIALSWRASGHFHGFEVDNLMETATVAWQWIKGRGLDPEELLIEKHEYNKGRPYKHGKVC